MFSEALSGLTLKKTYIGYPIKINGIFKVKITFAFAPVLEELLLLDEDDVPPKIYNLY